MKKNTDKENVVYVFIFEDEKVVYVGRTINPSSRKSNHSNDLKKNTDRKYVYNSPVYEYAKEHNIDIPEMKILEKQLSMKDSLIREDYWMSYYKKHGYTLLNRYPSGVFSGAAGSFEERYSDENLKELGQLFDSLIELKIKLPNTYKILKNKGLLDKLGIPSFPDISNRSKVDDSSKTSVRNFGEMIDRVQKLLNLDKS